MFRPGAGNMDAGTVSCFVLEVDIGSVESVLVEVAEVFVELIVNEDEEATGVKGIVAAGIIMVGV